MSMQTVVRGLLVVAVCLSFCACGPQERTRRQTYPVTGKVLVDGNPAAALKLAATGKTPGDPNYPILPQATTKDDGSFEFYSYEPGDGLPPDEYVLTFMWGQYDGVRYKGPDKLNGRYKDPAQSQVKVTVKDAPVDMGTIKLTTK
jgi:hypothetical protein